MYDVLGQIAVSGFFFGKSDVHIACFAGNEGREYVLRRILRRAVRYGTEVLKAQQGFFSRYAKVLRNLPGSLYFFGLQNGFI